MENGRYRVDPGMITPVALAMVSGALLLFLEGLTRKGFLLLLLLAPFFYLGAEILARKISLDDQGITISKFLRSVRIGWSEIQSLDAVRSGTKLFIILLGERGRPTLITNTISPFSDLVDKILGHVPSERIADGAVEILSEPREKKGPLVQAWIVCLVLVGLVAGKFMGY